MGRVAFQAVRLVVFFCAGMVAVAARAADSTALVRQLGDSSYAARRDATEQLLAAGREAEPALRAGLKSPDAEIRRRCRWLLEEIASVDFARRRAAFIADKEGSDGHGLPCWKAFQAIAGKEPHARELFVEMVRNEPALLQAAAEGGPRAAKALTQRLQKALRPMPSFSFSEVEATYSQGSLAAFWLIFSQATPAAAETDDDEHEGLPAYFVHNLTQQTEFQTLMRDAKFGRPMQRLVGHWLLSPTTPGQDYERLDLAIRYQLREGLPIAVKALRDKEQIAANYRGQAIVAVGALGGKPYAGLLHELLGDGRDAVPPRRRGNGAKLGDLALAWLIHVTEQDHTAYGMPKAKAAIQQILKGDHSGNDSFDGAFEFKDDGKRKEALKKWHEYVAKHPLPELPPEVPKADAKKAEKKNPAPLPVAPPAEVPLPGDVPLSDTLEEMSEDDQLGPGQVVGPLVPVRPGIPVAPPAPEADPFLAEDDEPAEEKRKPAAMRWPPADRELVRQLSVARELAADKHYARAARLVDEVLSSAGGSIFVPDRKAALVRSLHAEAERAISDWPAAARQAYALRHGAEAGETLAQAARAGDIALLHAVAARWFHTPAGAEASMLVAMHGFARGDVFHAAYRLERIRQHSAHADRLEPALSLRLALCWLQLGERRQAEAVLQALRQKQPNFAARLAAPGDAATLSLDALCKRLEAALPGGPAGDEGLSISSAWTAKRQPADVGMPWLKPAPLPVPKPDPRLAAAIERFHKEDAAQHRAALPAAPPLVVGNTALLRTATHLAAFNVASGELLWETPLEDQLQHYLRLNPPPPAPEKRKSLLGARLKSLFTGEALPHVHRAEQTLARSVRHRLWHDRSFGALASDGRRIFGVEHTAVELPDDYQRLLIDEQGEPAFDVGQPRRYNFLTAYDAATGKLLWEVGGATAEGMGLVDDTRAEIRTLRRGPIQFLGPPLPMAGRLFVLAEAHCATYLLELRAEDARLTSALMLTSRLPVRRYDMLGEDYVDDGEASSGGGSCALADGVLVCHNGTGKFFGVDIATRSFLWAYPLTELEPEPNEGEDEGVFIEPEMFADVEPSVENHWVDCGAVVVGERALLTSPKTQTLDCLRLADGKLLWSAPRRDGLYIGVVDRDRAIVVDRGGVRCLRLADGHSAWPIERLALPDGAVPCGRGYAGGGAFYLPLRPAAVLAIDIEHGRVLARHRGRESTPLGNLVAFAGGVVVQTAEGLFRCDSLAKGALQLAAELAARPDDPELLARHGEALMAAGRWREAVAAFRRVHKLRPTAATQRDLSDAVIDALRAEFTAFAPMAAEIEPELADRARAQLLRELAVGYQAVGQRREAFTRYLKLTEGTDLTKLERIETVREVRLDRWLAARLAEAYNAATPAERAEFDRQIAARWREEKHVEQLMLFGWHRSSVEARLKVAALAETAQQPHLAHWHLTTAQPLADGRQRDELARRLEKLAEATRRPAVVWPRGKVKVDFESQGNSVLMSLTLPVTGDGDDGFALRYDPSNDQLAGYDAAGRQLWRSAALAPAVDGGYFGGGAPGWRGWRLGRLLIVEAGGRVCALDALGKGEVLWCRQPELTDAVAVEVAAMGVESPAPELPGGERLAVAVGRQAVCFQIGARLFGVEPLTGTTLWMRDDLPGGCDLFGDDEALIVTPPDSTEALIISPVDGRDLGSCSAPPRDERLWTVGRDAVLWRPGNQRAQLLRVDVCERRIPSPMAGSAAAWQRSFAPQSRVCLVDGGLAAVCEPSGKVTLVRLADGRVTLILQLDAVPSFKGLAVMRGTQQWIVLAGTATSANPAGMFGWAQEGRGQFSFSGCVYAFDRAGKRQWTRDVTDQTLVLHQPADVPVLALVANREGKRLGPTKQECALLCLDRRTGAVLLPAEGKAATVKEYRDTTTEVLADPDKRTVEVRSAVGRAVFTFAEK